MRKPRLFMMTGGELDYMQEATVQKAVIEYLEQQGAISFVDPGKHSSYSVVRKRCETLPNCEINDSVKIGNRTPDVIGISDQRNIFAIETKGDDAIRKGIGQATHYRRGVHKSYLAAEEAALSRHADSAQAAGLGIIPVNSDGVVQDRIVEPNPNIAATDIAPVRRALALKTTELESGRLSIPTMYRPENALLPVLALKLANRGVMHVNECKDEIINSDANYSGFPDNPIRLARTLQLIDQDAEGNLRLTDHGETAYTIIKGLHALEGIDGELRVSTADTYRDYPPIVAFLRDRYFATPPIRLLARILAAQDGSRMEVSELLSAISRESPRVFQSLFCNDDEAFQDLLSDDDITDRDYRCQILDLTKVTALFNFTRQLEVIGVLEDGSDKTDTRQNMVIGNLYWEWDPDVVGQIGVF